MKAYNESEDKVLKTLLPSHYLVLANHRTELSNQNAWERLDKKKVYLIESH